VDTVGKDQGQVSRAIDRLVEVGLVVKKGSSMNANFCIAFIASLSSSNIPKKVFSDVFRGCSEP